MGGAVGFVGELQAYVDRPEPSFGWERRTLDGHEALRLTSQAWQGNLWKHDVVLIEPAKKTVEGSAIIEVTGWTPNQADYALAQQMADASGMTVAVLFQIPNEPLWGYEEDALIAHTFEEFLQTGDADWLLLFPMVKSVKATMTALRQSSAGALQTFVVTGASKRGWTTWLCGALGDPWIVGIAPRAFDNLDFVAQLKKQIDEWGEYSPMIRDYTDKGLQNLLGSDEGKRLVSLTDPLAYVDKINVPILVGTGTNDPFWTVDASQVYWGKLPTRKWSIAVPNGAHEMDEPARWAPTVGIFARACAMGRLLPTVTSRMSGDWTLDVDCTPGPIAYTVWKATADDMHFDKTVWTGERKTLATTDSKRGISVTGNSMKTKNLAILLELEFSTDTGILKLTTPVYVVRKR